VQQPDIRFSAKETNEKGMKSPSNIERLVLGCMDGYDSNQIVIFAAFFEIYKIFVFLHRSDLKISAKNRPIFWRNENEISFFIRVFR
jgi:hypothetical protein